jgi:hypothetical protein
MIFSCFSGCVQKAFHGIKALLYAARYKTPYDIPFSKKLSGKYRVSQGIIQTPPKVLRPQSIEE